MRRSVIEPRNAYSAGWRSCEEGNNRGVGVSTLCVNEVKGHSDVTPLCLLSAFGMKVVRRCVISFNVRRNA